MMGPEIIPGGSERCGDEELRRRGVFGLGWWKDAGCGDEVWNRCGDAGGEDLRHFAFCVHRIGKELVISASYHFPVAVINAKWT